MTIIKSLLRFSFVNIKATPYIHSTKHAIITYLLSAIYLYTFKINNIYHYQIIIKYQKEDNLISTLNFIIDMYKNNNNKIDVEVDFNPIRI